MLSKYIKNHPNIKFTFVYDPQGVSNAGDKRYWQVKFSKPIKDTHTIGYACESFAELINAIINEKD